MYNLDFGSRFSKELGRYAGIEVAPGKVLIKTEHLVLTPELAKMLGSEYYPEDDSGNPLSILGFKLQTKPDGSQRYLMVLSGSVNLSMGHDYGHGSVAEVSLAEIFKILADVEFQAFEAGVAEERYRLEMKFSSFISADAPVLARPEPDPSDDEEVPEANETTAPNSRW
jgi:hypothetical protein